MNQHNEKTVSEILKNEHTELLPVNGQKVTTKDNKATSSRADRKQVNQPGTGRINDSFYVEVIGWPCCLS